MRQHLTFEVLLIVIMLAMSVPRAQAHCLVLRARGVSEKRSSETSAAESPTSPAPVTSSLLVFVDLEMEYQRWDWNIDPKLSTAVDSIILDEGSSNSFATRSWSKSYAKAHYGWQKFGFFKSGTYFYYMRVGAQDFGPWGLDAGMMSCSGPCTASEVDIGGGSRRIRVPNDFVAVQTRADAGTFKTNISNVSVDLVLTRAVNDFLLQSGFISATGSERVVGANEGVFDTARNVSVAVAKAVQYLSTTYLPNAGYTRVTLPD